MVHDKIVTKFEHRTYFTQVINITNLTAILHFAAIWLRSFVTRKYKQKLNYLILFFVLNLF